MTAFTTLLDGTPSKASGGARNAGTPAFTVFEGFYDATKRPITTSDTIDLIDLPAGTTVLASHIEVIGTQATITLGASNGSTIFTTKAVATAGVVDGGTTAFFTAAASTVALSCASANASTVKVRIKLYCLVA
jgi:hypothetical protein